MKTAIEMILDERRRQIEVEGWTLAHDDDHEDGELSLAAACYAAYPLVIYFKNEIGFKKLRPFDEYDIKDGKTEIQQLVAAGALIVAEIEKIQRENRDNP